MEPATWFCQNHGFSRCQVGRVAIARALSQNTDPNNGDDVETGLNGVTVLKEWSICDPGRSNLQTVRNYTQGFLCPCIFTDENRPLDHFNQNGRLGTASNMATHFVDKRMWSRLRYLKLGVLLPFSHV